MAASTIQPSGVTSAARRISAVATTRPPSSTQYAPQGLKAIVRSSARGTSVLLDGSPGTISSTSRSAYASEAPSKRRGYRLAVLLVPTQDGGLQPPWILDRHAP